MALSEDEEFELLSLERQRSRQTPTAAVEPSSNLAIAENAANKGVAALPDMVLNTPTNLLNLGKAGFGTAATALGRPDLAPDLTQNPDIARRAMEGVGLIKPDVVPQGSLQKGIDLITQGAVGGALTGGASIPRALTGAAMGALSAGTGGAVEAVGGSPALAAAASLAVPIGAARLLGSRGAALTPQQQLLKKENVSMTPGQIKGGAMQRFEDAAQSYPFMGDAIKGAQRRGIESFDVAALNRALKPIGGEVPKGLEVQKAVEYTRSKLGDAYEALLPNLKGELNTTKPGTALTPNALNPNAVGATGTGRGSLKQELDAIRNVGQNLPEPQRGQLGRIIDREVVDRFTKFGLASGDTLKDIESELNNLAKGFRRSDNYDTRNLGKGVEEIQAALRRMIENVNPNYRGELQKINEGYANFKKVQSAAADIGARDSVFTPAQLHRAVRRQDTTKDKRAFSEGKATMQDLSSAGKAVLSQTVPDSGTPFRLAVLNALNHPLLTAAGIAGTVPYSRAGQGVLEKLLLRKGRPGLGEVARRAVPIGTLASLLEQHEPPSNPQH